MVGPILSKILRGHRAKKTGIISKLNQNKKLKSTKYAEFYLEFDGHNLIINLWAQIQVLI